MAYPLEGHPAPARRRGDAQVAPHRLRGSGQQALLRRRLRRPEHFLEPGPAHHHLGDRLRSGGEEPLDRGHVTGVTV